MPQVGQLHRPGEVDGFARAGLDEGLQRPAEQVVAFEVGIAEGDDLGQEAVDADESAEIVAEPVLLILGRSPSTDFLSTLLTRIVATRFRGTDFTALPR